jgi:hypothetical protein
MRTRSDGEVEPVDAVAFFTHELPERFERHADLAVPGAQELHPRSLALDVDGAAWTLELAGDRLTVSPGSDDADAVWRLDAEGLSDLVNDVRGAMGFFTGGDLDMPRGKLEDALDWHVILRSVIDERPVHTTGAVTFRDRDGEPLDLHRTFTLDDDLDEIAHFLGEAGYLHVAGVFTEAEMAAVSDDIDAAVSSYEPDDGRSWWATTADGEHRAVRLQHFHEHSETTDALLRDERLARFGQLTSDGHHIPEGHRGGNVIEALIKPIGVVEGISDVPWHKDCSLGGHSYGCCSMTVGISVTGADASSGQLRVVAGSHRALIQPAFVRRGLDLPQVDLPTSTGDITVHLSCTMHMAQPPVTSERKVMYTGLRLLPRDAFRGAGEPGSTGHERLAKLGRIREGAYKTVSQPPALFDSGS